MKRVLSALLCAVTTVGLFAGVAAQQVEEVDYSLYSTYYVLENGEVVSELNEGVAQPEEDGPWRASQEAIPIEEGKTTIDELLTSSNSILLRYRASIDAIERMIGRIN